MDWDEIEQLLNILDKARQWPNLRHIHDGAMRQLEERKDPELEAAERRLRGLSDTITQEKKDHEATREAHRGTQGRLNEALRELEMLRRERGEPASRTVGPQGATVTHPSVPADNSGSEGPFSAGGTIASRRSLAETSGGSSDAA